MRERLESTKKPGEKKGNLKKGDPQKRGGMGWINYEIKILIPN